MNDLDSLARFPSRARARTDASLDATLEGQQLFIQGDQSIANQAGAAFRSDLNNELQALVTFSRGTAAPGTTYAGQQWDDTTANVTKKRNTANSGWIVKDTLDEAFVLSRASNTILGLSDINKTLLATAGFTQTLTAAATLGDGWSVNFINTHASAACTLDPNAAETINGAATLTVPAGAGGQIVCNGSSFRMLVTPYFDGTDWVFMTAGGTQAKITNTATTTRWVIITGSNGGNPAVDTSAGSLNLAATSQAVTLGVASGTAKLTTVDVNGQITFGGDPAVGSGSSYVIVTGSGSGNSGAMILNSTIMLFKNSGAEVARFTSGGYLKASNDGSYYSSSGSAHELRQNASGTELGEFTHSHATNPIGLIIRYTGAAPNGTGNVFLECDDSGTLRASLRSNGGLANFSANNVNLSDERVKKLLTPFGALDASIVSPASNDARYVPSMRDLWNAHKQMRGVWCAFQYDDQNGEHYNYGYTAQGVARAFEKAAPDLVVGWDAEGRRLGVRGENLHAITGAVVTELQHRSDDHDGELRRLRNEVDELREQLGLKKAA